MREKAQQDPRPRGRGYDVERRQARGLDCAGSPEGAPTSACRSLMPPKRCVCLLPATRSPRTTKGASSTKCRLRAEEAHRSSGAGDRRLCRCRQIASVSSRSRTSPASRTSAVPADDQPQRAVSVRSRSRSNLLPGTSQGSAQDADPRRGAGAGHGARSIGQTSPGQSRELNRTATAFLHRASACRSSSCI